MNRPMVPGLKSLVAHPLAGKLGRRAVENSLTLSGRQCAQDILRKRGIELGENLDGDVSIHRLKQNRGLIRRMRLEIGSQLSAQLLRLRRGLGIIWHRWSPHLGLQAANHLDYKLRRKDSGCQPAPA
jgi:hypothetical protein